MHGDFSMDIGTQKDCVSTTVEKCGKNSYHEINLLHA